MSTHKNLQRVARRADCEFMDLKMRRRIVSLALRFMILERIMKGDAYPYEIFKSLCSNKRLAAHFENEKNEIKNMVYNNLSSLEKGGYISQRASSGKKEHRKYYVITPKGREAVDIKMKMVLSFIKELYEVIS